ncbi:SDR family NAD(P)-dependent oxidoreductase [Caballeronia cordobensis]|uniref:SDR family NAD(P)-dependent oxidoreductase n=1 Tax=Caballeronia cordobensis TaxID=1353886 RepID=UPI002AA5A590
MPTPQAYCNAEAALSGAGIQGPHAMLKRGILSAKRACHANQTYTTRRTGHRYYRNDDRDRARRRAPRRCTRLMLVSREETALTELVRELSREAKDCVAHTVADVGDRKQLQAAADAAIQRFGGFDTWINNVGLSIYGRCADVPLDEQRKLFDTNF